MKTESTWGEIKRKKIYPALSHDITTDVVVIGGGITGVLTAYLLAQQGKDVVLIEKKTIGSGATEHTTAFMTQDIDTELTALVDTLGSRKAKAVWQSHHDAIKLIADIVKKENIPCEFTYCSTYIYANTDDDATLLMKEDTTAKKFGFTTTYSKKNNLGFSNHGYMEIKKQAKFHPLQFLYGLLPAITSNGGQIYEHTQATKITSKKNGVTITTTNGTITATYAIVATYIPFHNPLVLFAKKGIYTSYVLEVQIPKNTILEGQYLDLANPYHYFRIDPQKQYDRVIIGGEDHRHELPVDEEKSFAALETYMKEIFHTIPYTITRRWKGPIAEPSDGLAYIGKVEHTLFVATGFSGNGMTYAGIAAMLFRDSILKKKNPYIRLYDPNRIPTMKQLWQKGLDYTEEFFGGAVKNTFAMNR